MQYKLSKYCIDIGDRPEGKVLFNAVTGGVVLLEYELFQLLSQSSVSETIRNFSSLKREHYLVPESQNEYLFLRFSETRALHDESINDTLSYVIAPTTSCNLRCSYCFENGKRSSERLDKTTSSAIASFIIDSAKKLP